MNEINNSNQIQVKQENDSKLKGISGWLIFPAIGLIFTLIIGIMDLLALILIYKKIIHADYSEMFTLKIIILFVVLIFTIYILFIIYAMIRFFRKKKNAPRIMIIFLCINILLSVIFLYLNLYAGANVTSFKTWKQLIHAIISAAIWIPYFNVSKRVKATFVN